MTYSYILNTKLHKMRMIIVAFIFYNAIAVYSKYRDCIIPDFSTEFQSPSSQLLVDPDQFYLFTFIYT